MQSEQKAMRAIVLGLMTNTVLCVIKILGGVVGNSYALIADGVESALDILGSLIAWGGLKISTAPPDENHPYGHGRAESLAAIVVALLLIGGAIGISVESIRELIAPRHAPEPFTLLILISVIVVKEVLSRIVGRHASSLDSVVLTADAWHHRADALTSLVAAIGISVAIIGGQGFEGADDIAALAASSIIAYNGVSILRIALNEIMDSTPSTLIHDNVRSIASTVEGVKSIDECRLRKNGIRYLVDIHVVVDGDLSVRDGHEIARKVRRALTSSPLRIQDALVHIEPWDGSPPQ